MGTSYIASQWKSMLLWKNWMCRDIHQRSCIRKKWKSLSGESKSVPEIVSNLDNDNGQTWKNEFLENFGYGLANVIDILDPDAIVLGGGLSNIDFLYTEGKKSVYEKVFSDLVDTPILKNELGDSAGVFGAALLN